MCAGAKAIIGDLEVNVYMGYYGGGLTLGNSHYSAEPDQYDHNEDTLSKQEAIDILSKFSSQELATLIVALVENSYEA